jgi:dihydropteroate synthase
VPADEQIRRTVDLVRRIRLACDAAITIDTTSAEVAAAALDAGADAVNDVSAGTDDPAMLPFVASRGAGIVLMHRVLPPGSDRWSHEHREPLVGGDIVRSVADHLLARVDAALAAGVDRGSIAIDPGLGFGKTVEQNFALVARIAELADLGLPIVFGASRKSFIGAATGRAAPLERVVGGVVAASIACAVCPLVVRTHDVPATRDGLRTMQAVRAASLSP